MGMTPVVRAGLLRYGLMDIPNPRSAHTVPTPRGGGIACALGVFLACVAAALADRHVPWGAMVSVFALAGVGYADDRLRLPAGSRLATQTLAGATIGLALGGQGLVFPGALVTPIVVNAVNFMDGINGITALTMVLWGAVATSVGSNSGVADLSLLGTVSAASALGFLPWNSPRARVFLGDSGSYLFGALVATGLLLGKSHAMPMPVLGAPLAVYFADTGFTLAVRLIRQERLFEAHREHVYQRLVHDLGRSHVTVALWVASTSGLIVATWILTRTWVALSFTVVALAVYVCSVPISRAVARQHFPGQLRIGLRGKDS